MLTGVAREQLKNILEYLSENDLRVIELKIVPGTPRSNSSSERINDILSCAPQPSDILLHKNMRKSVLRRYLWQNGINVTKEQSKADYIMIMLGIWKVQYDDFLKKYSTKHNFHQALRDFTPPKQNKETDDLQFQHIQQAAKTSLDSTKTFQQHYPGSTPSDASSAIASPRSPSYAFSVIGSPTSLSDAASAIASLVSQWDATSVIASPRSPSDASSVISSPRSSAISSFTRKDVLPFSLTKQKRKASPDEISINRKKVINSSVPTIKVENTSASPDVQTNIQVGSTKSAPLFLPQPSTKSFSRKRRDSSEEMSTLWEKIIKSSAPNTNVENICVTPDLPADL